ncbi:hypothetical protein MRB53_010392 [Persea americana]|uniref:Uncharacterized protein n=1 Tax=Persea americana TaxID=3435 RepID=A0ACC2LS15_PERAE|nr:hypothetical protein MRB53_010392 [Persea americana]
MIHRMGLVNDVEFLLLLLKIGDGGRQDAYGKSEIGTRTVEDYTTEFYQLLARNEIQELEDQLVAQYIGGLRVQIQDTVNLLDQISVLAAHQKALQASSNPTQTNRTINSGIECFGYGETSHKRSECKKTGKRALIADTDDGENDWVKSQLLMTLLMRRF